MWVGHKQKRGDADEETGSKRQNRGAWRAEQAAKEAAEKERKRKIYDYRVKSIANHAAKNTVCKYTREDLDAKVASMKPPDAKRWAQRFNRSQDPKYDVYDDADVNCDVDGYLMELHIDGFLKRRNALVQDGTLKPVPSPPVETLSNPPAQFNPNTLYDLRQLTFDARYRLLEDYLYVDGTCAKTLGKKDGDIRFKTARGDDAFGGELTKYADYVYREDSTVQLDRRQMPVHAFFVLKTITPRFYSELRAKSLAGNLPDPSRDGDYMYLTLICSKIPRSFERLHAMACQFARTRNVQRMVLASMPDVLTLYPKYGYTEIASRQGSRPVSPEHFSSPA